MATAINIRNNQVDSNSSIKYDPNMWFWNKHVLCMHRVYKVETTGNAVIVWQEHRYITDSSLILDNIKNSKYDSKSVQVYSDGERDVVMIVKGVARKNRDDVHNEQEGFKVAMMKARRASLKTFKRLLKDNVKAMESKTNICVKTVDYIDKSIESMNEKARTRVYEKYSKI